MPHSEEIYKRGLGFTNNHIYKDEMLLFLNSKSQFSTMSFYILLL